ncbi:hypothetical protein CYLTODRAFT_292190 [Cylindrobasidium torrendii FP15055 ss-10]|uniref:Acid protease n=1 Tax=Cylindrobasidium torrendii FP15055 ss-10 TaxID=1314674 RepID=A0A0D7BA98_9AGAR|nr:hypothetical protein CYLTODRAFT_292190 [Cylindrobasidium torrendii FP15055 ss-10]
MTVSSFSGVMGVQLLVFLFMLALDVCALRTGLHEGAHPTLDDRDPAIIATNNAIIGADATLRLEMGRSNVLLSAASHGQDIVINVSGIDFSLQHQKIQDDNNLEATAGYISLFFERNDDRAAPGEVTLAVGKDIPRLDTVLAMPHIPALLSPSNGQESSQNFLSIAMKTSIVAHTMDHPIDLKGPIALSLASPYSLVPANVAHAIYSDIGGAELVNGLWSLPCDTRIGTSVIIGGEMYPIHPWDTVILSSPLTEGQCAGPFQPLQDEHDGVTLGWSFVRNVYMLAHAGDNITGEGPYIQLLSVSNETGEFPLGVNPKYRPSSRGGRFCQVRFVQGRSTPCHHCPRNPPR